MAKSNNLKQGDSPPLIVGIGASAGAVDTLGAFFEDIPENPGVAFVVVIHLSPDHTSTLPDLISRHTSVPAVHAENGQRVEVNRIYVIPPDTELALMNGTLHLMPRKEQRPWLPIDSFFRTLADEAGDHAIGIVLSGTGSDGSLGLQAIKAHLGLTMAQSPESAAFPGMPQAAIDSGAVDHVSNPKGLATELLDYAAHFAKRRENEEDGEEEIEEQMNKIFVILRRQVGHDFSAYKESTVHRRLKRRLDVHKVDALEEYVRYLQNSPREVELLFRDLLIGVTQFFREPEAFEKLKQSVLPELVRDRGEDEPIRVWVPGCSSGEEAYSMAITIREFLDDNGMTTPVNIFATDIDEEAIERARRGVFPIAIQRDVGERRAQRFFAQKGDSYEVAQSVRQMIVFSTQDVIKDAPFTRLDLLSCRNVMIYLKPEVQKRLVPLFHYSLNAGGFLLLGSSETVGNFPDLFSSIPGDARIYRAKSADAGVYARTGVEFPIGTRGTDDGTRRVRRHASPVQTERVLQRFLLNRHTPPTVFVNRKREVVYIHGRTGRYFELATGMARMDIVEMARGAISLPLSQALRQAFREEQLVERTGIRLEEGGSPTLVHLSVEPVREHENGPDLFAVVLTEEPLAESSEGGERSAGADESGDSATDEQVRHLESELQATRERLQTTVEELERRARELQRGDAEPQRGAEHRQQRVTNEERGARPQQRRDEELPRQPSHSHRIRRQPAPHQALHSRGNQAHQHHRHRRESTHRPDQP